MATLTLRRPPPPALAACRRALVLAALLLLPLDGRAQADFELRLKAALLFNLAQFVTWPPEAFADAQGPLRFCMVDAAPLARALADGVRGRTIGGRSVDVLPVGTLAPELGCHIAYLGEDAQRTRSRSVEGADGWPVLTVHESEAPAATGVVRLFTAGERLRFEINTAAAARRRLGVSAKLLQMARVVNQ